MRIHKYTFVENLFSLIIAGLLSELVLSIYLLNMLNNISWEKPKIKPVYEKIIEQTNNDIIVIKEPEDIIEESEEEIIEDIIISNMILDANLGRVQGPQEVETYYNLPMENVIQKMREMGYVEADYPYYIREDGVRMLGDFIMVAADLNKYPKGTIVQTSLGQGIVCDTYTADEDLFDIAVNW